MHGDKKDKDELFITVRRIDGAWRVVASDDEVEHTHEHPFRSRKRAWALATEIRVALGRGRDLNLARWHTETLSDGRFC